MKKLTFFFNRTKKKYKKIIFKILIYKKYDIIIKYTIITSLYISKISSGNNLNYLYNKINLNHTFKFKSSI